MSSHMGRSLRAGLMLSALLLGGCVLAPRETKDEKARLDEAGAEFERPMEKREVPQLSSSPSWKQILRRAFLTHGELEAAYYEWKAAMHRIDMSSAWPNSNISLGFEYMFSSEKMKSWDRTTISAEFDPSMNLSLPNKVAQAGKVSLEEARAAGFRFEQLKFDIQARVLEAWLDYARTAELVRIERDNVELLRLLTDTAAARVQAGAPQQDLLKAQIQLQLAENELATMESDLVSMRAKLNSLVARDPDAPLDPPAELPAPRAMPVDDARIIGIAVDKNKELSALARQVQGRKDALELARMQWLPDISPAAGFTGSIEQFVGAMIMLPTAVPMIQGAINESRAMLQAQEAMLRQGRLDRAGEVVAALVLARNAERQTNLFEQQVLPKAEQALESARQSYAAGTLAFIELIDAQRTLLDVRRMVAEARIAREKALAELECLICADLETVTEGGTTAEQE